MFGIGIGELIVIAVVALVLVGPKKLPDLMKQAGKFFVQMRRTANDVKSTFDDFVKQAENELRQDEIEQLKVALGKQNQDLKSIEAGVANPGGEDLSSSSPKDADHGYHHSEELHDHHHDPEHHRHQGHEGEVGAEQPANGSVPLDPSPLKSQENPSESPDGKSGLPHKLHEPL
jgi:Tat protein translocase TatB subunit